MNSVLLSVLLLAGVGLAAGVLLSVAAKVFAVPVDKKAEDIEAILPGANCGGCGYSGCAGYAAALSSGETTDTGRCGPGGAEAAAKISAYLGVESGSFEKTCAVVRCNGTDKVAVHKMEYAGVSSCVMADRLYGGEKSCMYGCMGLGDCVRACPYGAIRICDGTARVSPAVCRSCGKCVAACPKGLIEILPVGSVRAVVLCKNKDRGNLTRKECENGCIGCMKCVKACEVGAVKVENFCATVDASKCTGCGKCAEGCPTGAIGLFGPAV